MTGEAAIHDAPIHVSENDLVDLRRRLAEARWPERETVNDWSQGAPLDRVRALCDYWLHRYDWRRCEAMLNGWNPHSTVLDGLSVTFFHIRSPEPGALPMIMTHGWPGSVVEFNRVVGPLTDPVAHGGEALDAFHLVLPCLPGFGFSEKPTAPGWTADRIAQAWPKLMARLGYDRWVAQGGDWGANVTGRLAAAAPPGCMAIHLNTVDIGPDPAAAEDDSPGAKRARDLAEDYGKREIGYAKQQSTRPQTLAYALTDSPVGQAAWIYEKYKAWMDPAQEPEAVFGFDAMLDNIMVYWLTRTGGSSARLYWESLAGVLLDTPVAIPVAVSLFPHDVTYTPRHWAERLMSNIVSWNEVEAGGHLAAFEQPEIFVREVRAAFREIRDGTAPSRAPA